MRNTTVSEEDNQKCVKLYDTEIVRFDQNVIVLDSGGYFTKTTKNRINEVSREFDLGIYVSQKGGNWYVEVGDKVIDFENKMEIKR